MATSLTPYYDNRNFFDYFVNRGLTHSWQGSSPRLELTAQKVLCPPMDMAPDITKVVVSYPVIHYPLWLRAPPILA